MKTKKITKLLIAATAIAAVMGVSAVSFAAWTGNNGGNATLSASTDGFGTIDIPDGDTPLAGLPTDGVTFVPYNQTNMGSMTGTKVVSYKVKDFSTNVNYKLNLTVTTESALKGSFYYMYGDSEVTEAPADLVGWTKLTAGTAAVLAEGTAKEYTTVTGKYLSIVLDSSDNADMNKSGITFTVSLAQNA